MTTEEQIKALAELDGMQDFDMLKKQTGDLTRYLHGANRKESVWRLVPDYLTSYDAIIPLIQKQSQVIQNIVARLTVRMLAGGDNKRWRYFPENMSHYAYIYMNATPSQLSEALLRATGKWKD